MRRDSFATAGGYDPAAHAQALLTSLSSFEERQRQRHPGRNQTSHTDDRPIIGRGDLFDLDKSLAYDAKGKRRPDGNLNLIRAAEDVVREKFTRRGIPAIFSLHDEQDGNGNFHVHVTSSYRQLTPEGWAQRKERPFGKAVWRGYWEDGAKILRNIQLRLLSRLGVDVERPQRLAMLSNAARSMTANPVKGALRQSPKTGDCRAEITRPAVRSPTIAAPCFPSLSRGRGVGAYRQFPRPPPVAQSRL